MTQHPRRWTRLFALAALAALPTLAAAQGMYAEQVGNYLDEMQARVEAEGYTFEGESTGWMVGGARGATVVRLPAGSYVAIGACDDDCSDIDLVASLMNASDNLDLDEEDDSFPIVQFTLTEASDVMIGISMPGCATARCYVGYRWLVQDAEDGGADMPGSWEDQVRMQLEALDFPGSASVQEESTGLVAAGEEDRLSYDLPAGSYQAWAVCDFDCSDVDLAVYDAGGSLIGSDTLTDDMPVVEFEVRKGGGRYYIAVQMVDCSTGTCGYGFRLFKVGSM